MDNNHEHWDHSGDKGHSDYRNHELAPVDGFPDKQEKSDLRLWWFNLLRKYNKHSLFAIFLILPSDKEAIRYLTEFSRELHLVSGENCLVLGMMKTEIQHPRNSIFGYDEQLWNVVIEEQAFEGYSLNVARLFNIDISDFPCLILFRDIRSPEHLTISLKAMKAEEIVQQTRVLFSIVNKAIADKKDPLIMIERQRNNEQFKKTGTSIISELRSITGKTFETVIEATINAIIK